jgi:apolipoprotein N-acyltransferase
MNMRAAGGPVLPKVGGTTKLGLIARVMLSILSGVLIAAPFLRFQVGFLAWVGLLPLLFAIEQQPPLTVSVLAFAQGLTLNLMTMAWLAIPTRAYAHWGLIAAAATPALVSVAEAGFISVSLTLAVFVARRARIPLLLALPASWTAVEWIRSFLPIGFPWNLLGYAVSAEKPIIQIAEITGIYGISALVVLANVAIYDLISRGRRPRALAYEACAVAAVLTAVILFGMERVRALNAVRPENRIKVAMVQGNIPQNVKWNPKAAPGNFKVYEAATRAAAREHPDLVIWPETADPYILQPNAAYPVSFSTALDYYQKLLDLAGSTRTNILLGATAVDFGRTITAKNRVYLISKRGEMVDYYDKLKLVPLGEYFPIPKVFGHTPRGIVDTPLSLPMAPGRRQTIFEVGDAKIAALICYESIFPNLARSAVEAGANMLVNLTNDAWYGKSAAPYQLLAMTSLRAVENRVPVVIVGNTGFTAVVTPTGQITAPTKLFTRATVLQTVEWSDAMTFYSVMGDLFAEICFALTLVGLLMAVVGPNRVGHRNELIRPERGHGARVA